MDYKKEIIKRIHELSGSRSPYDVFYAWVTCMALAIQNGCTLIHDETWQAREDQYIKTVQPYGEDENILKDMMGMLACAMEEEPRDYLGEIYMESGCGNKNTGQFFTPFHLSYLCAKAAMKGIDPEKVISLNEPSCGGGGLIIAAARVLLEQGINYQRVLDVVAQDLDWKAVYMCYVQLSLLGIKAIVIQGNTLAEPSAIYNCPPERVFWTPKKIWRLV